MHTRNAHTHLHAATRAHNTHACIHVHVCSNPRITFLSNDTCSSSSHLINYPVYFPVLLKDQSDELAGDETDFTFFWNDKGVEPDSDQLSHAKSEAVVSKEVDTPENSTCKAKASGIAINTHYKGL